MDFRKGDRIDLSGIDANEAAGGNQAFRLDAGGGFTIGEMRLVTKGKDVVIELNTDKDAAVDAHLFVVNAKLGAGDFVL